MKKFLALLIAVFLVFAVAGCSPNTSGKLAKIQEKGTLVVYTSPDFPPFEYTSGGNVVGVDADLAAEIAKELGVTIEWKSADFEGICASIASGRGDIAISGMTITEKRKKSVDFSNPYFDSAQYLILREDSDIATFEDLAGKKVGVAKGYTGSFVLDNEMNGSKDDKGNKVAGILEGKNTVKTTYNNAAESVLDLKKAGGLDAVIMDKYVAEKLKAQNDGIKVIPLVKADGSDAAEQYGVVVAKGNKDLLEIINRVVDRLVDEDKINEWRINHEGQ